MHTKCTRTCHPKKFLACATVERGCKAVSTGSYSASRYGRFNRIHQSMPVQDLRKEADVNLIVSISSSTSTCHTCTRTRRARKRSDLALPHYDTHDVSAITDLPYMVVSHDLGQWKSARERAVVRSRAPNLLTP